jgi:uncharacterized protein YndB with AHSA1/START domain
MLKWIGGCLVVAIVLIAVVSFFGLRTMKNSLSPDGSARVTIAATPTRVFASLANGDSVGGWMAPGSSITTAKHGPLTVGDSIRIQLKGALGMTQPPVTWHVVQVVPDHLLVLRMTGGPNPNKAMTAILRDTLIARGDSTDVISTLTSSTLDSLRKDKSNITGDMLLDMLRIQSKLELDMLRNRIENRLSPRPVPARR